MKINLDNYQQKAVYTKHKNSLIVAAPGSGKTTVIINRVNHLIEDRKVKVGNIIVITFTRAAAENMKSRYKNTFNKETAPFFGTFHGLFYKILLREGNEINIIKDNKCSNIVKGVLGKYFDDVNEDKVKDVVNNISSFKTSSNSIDDFKTTISKDIFTECYNAYENYKKKENLWDFDDLSVNALNLLKDNKEVLSKYKNIFKYVLVDEFQDCDELQVEFLRFINGENELFAVGDEDQCIYSFRGSKPQYMVEFCSTFKDGKKLYLSINYRSSRNIVDSSKKIILNNANRNHKNIEEFHSKEGIIKFSKPYNEHMQGDEIANTINSFKEGQYIDNAVLYRTNMEARSLIDTFTRRKIPFVLLDKGYNFFNHFISKDIISYLRMAIDIKNKELFSSIINKPFRYVSKANISYINSYKEDIDPFEILINKKDTPPFQCKKLDELRRDILYLNKISLGSAIQYIISSLGYIDYLREYANKYGQNFEELEDMLEEFKGASEGFKTIIEFLVHVKNVDEEIEKSKTDKNGVILSTIHGVKGMEFKNVFIINCDEETIPHKSSIEENLEEERRLFYVAVTRAIHNLYIFSPKTIRSKFYEPSRFIKEGGFLEESLKVEYGVKIGDSIYHRTYGEGLINELKEDKVSIKFKDGSDRAFSLRVLMENNLIMIMN